MSSDMQQDAPTQPKGRKRSRIPMLLVSVLTIGAALYLYYRWRELGFDWGEFAGTFRDVQWGWVGAAGVFALLTYLGRALRWKVLLSPVRPDASLRNLLSATTIGFTAVVLFGRAGELIRPYLIAVREGVPFSSQVAAWLTERIYDLFMALILFGIGLSHVQDSGMEVGPRLEWVLRIGGYTAAGIGLVCLSILFLFGRYARSMERRLIDGLAILPQRVLEKTTKAVSEFSRTMEGTGKKELVAKLVAYSFLEWFLILACYLCVLRASPATSHLQVTDAIILVGFTAFGGVVQIPGVGGGAQVVIVIVLTEMYRIGLEAASSMAILIWIITFVVIVPIGLATALHEGLSWRKLREIEQEARV